MLERLLAAAVYPTGCNSSPTTTGRSAPVTTTMIELRVFFISTSGLTASRLGWIIADLPGLSNIACLLTISHRGVAECTEISREWSFLRVLGASAVLTDRLLHFLRLCTPITRTFVSFVIKSGRLDMKASPIVLSHVQAAALLAAHQAGHTAVEASLDLGLTTVEVGLDAETIALPDGQRLTWQAVEAIAGSERGCFFIEGGEPLKIQFFSEASNRLYSLMPTDGAPTMLVSGIPMHRFKGIDPHRDTLLKIKTIAPVTGRALDTATGLGYTAIEAAKTADHVTTIEIEPTALEVARLNPWSQRLFANPRITQVVGDVYDEIEAFEDEAFDCIIHDPPAFSLAGDLYAGAFYRELFRVLRRKGRMFHYVGDLESKSGRTVTKGAVRRLQEAGFLRVARRPEAFGLVAYK